MSSSEITFDEPEDSSCDDIEEDSVGTAEGDNDAYDGAGESDNGSGLCGGEGDVGSGGDDGLESECGVSGTELGLGNDGGSGSEGEGVRLPENFVPFSTSSV